MTQFYTEPGVRMGTFAERVVAFNKNLRFEADLPEGIRVMNPFQENAGALAASAAFYHKYYNDNKPRRLILGINPGRFGAGLTGVPFTDPKRLLECCGIDAYQGPPAHEPSSVFVYEVIRQYGGEAAFYGDWYINSICPLGFTAPGKKGREVNFNYYDRKDLQQAATPFMLNCLRQQLAFPIATDVCFCLGTGKNAAFITALNRQHHFFGRVAPLEHPRYVIQYKSKSMQHYVDKYLALLKAAAA